MPIASTSRVILQLLIAAASGWLHREQEPLLVDLRRRIRDVKQGRDGLLYVLTDERFDKAGGASGNSFATAQLDPRFKLSDRFHIIV
jgi:glucose/arabinose dehydrogenase